MRLVVVGGEISEVYTDKQMVMMMMFNIEIGHLINTITIFTIQCENTLYVNATVQQTLCGII